MIIRSFISALLCNQIIVITAASAAETGTPVEVMPLHTGNTWTYSYRLITLEQSGDTYDDSGTVRCAVIGTIQIPDSTRWVVAERRDFIRRVHAMAVLPRDTSYAVIDSAAFEIVERPDGLHHLYRNEDADHIWNSSFPWGRDILDTASVYRYAYVDSADVTHFETRSGTIPYSFYYTYTFQRGLGEIIVQTRTSEYVVGLISTTTHTLLQSVINSVDDGPRASPAEVPALSQNYPNPFNPATTIRYGLPHRSAVSLIVYNTLGQKVAILAEGEQEAGYHEVRFDGTGLASGVYVYRLRAGEYAAAKRFLLIR